MLYEITSLVFHFSCACNGSACDYLPFTDNYVIMQHVNRSAGFCSLIGFLYFNILLYTELGAMQIFSDGLLQVSNCLLPEEQQVNLCQI